MKCACCFFLPLLFVLSGCSREDTIFVRGMIIEKDNSPCICCGGYIIAIDNMAYRAFKEDFPEDGRILDGASLPMEVMLRFKKKEQECQDHISINAIRRR